MVIDICHSIKWYRYVLCMRLFQIDSSPAKYIKCLQLDKRVIKSHATYVNPFVDTDISHTDCNNFTM